MGYEYKVFIKNGAQNKHIVGGIYKSFKEVDMFRNAQLEDDKIIISEYWMTLGEESENEIYYSISADKDVRERVNKIISNTLTKMGMDFVCEEE